MNCSNSDLFSTNQFAMQFVRFFLKIRTNTQDQVQSGKLNRISFELNRLEHFTHRMPTDSTRKQLLANFHQNWDLVISIDFFLSPFSHHFCVQILTFEFCFHLLIFALVFFIVCLKGWRFENYGKFPLNADIVRTK